MAIIHLPQLGGGSPVSQGTSTNPQPQQSGLNDLRDRQIKVDPIKVYVLESDITNTQADVGTTKQVSVIK